MMLPDTVVQSSKDMPCREQSAGYRPTDLSGSLSPNKATAVLVVPAGLNANVNISLIVSG